MVKASRRNNEPSEDLSANVSLSLRCLMELMPLTLAATFQVTNSSATSSLCPLCSAVSITRLFLGYYLLCDAAPDGSRETDINQKQFAMNKLNYWQIFAARHPLHIHTTNKWNTFTVHLESTFMEHI